MKEYTLNDIESILQSEGYKIKKRTLIHYRQIGLLPWLTKQRFTHQFGVYGFYTSDVLDRIRRILDFKKEGRSMSEIQMVLK